MSRPDSVVTLCQAPAPALDAARRPAMALLSAHRAVAPLAAVSDQQPAVCGPGGPSGAGSAEIRAGIEFRS